MKRFWLVLMSLGLVMAFSVSAFAVDVKVSGEYYVAGLYLDKVSLQNTPATYDTAFFIQRMRIGTDFIVADSLKLVTRFDAMEREWGMRGGDDADPNTGAGSTSIKPRTQENIEFDLVYVDYTSPIGLFQVGYLEDYTWGTIWGNRATGPTAGQIKYFLPIGPVTMVFAYAKEADNSLSAKQKTVFAEDLDYDSYRVGPIFKFKTDAAAGEAGILFIFNNIRNHRADTVNPYRQDGYVFQPYFKTNIGPLFLQGELNYYTGKRYSETTLAQDQDIDALSFWLDGDAKFGIVGVGGSLAFVQGDNNSTDNKINNALTGGRDWDPCLIMFNNTVLNSWAGAITGYNSTSVNGEMSNAWFFQGRFNVTPDSESKFTAGMSVSYAFADKDLGSGTDRGLEVDVTGTYKITNNLSYMLGVGYLFTGDYYKGSTAGADVNNDYLVINKLTLKF
jgi:hypothetical protein